MAQLDCCLTHILRSMGSSPSNGSLLFAFISMCYYMIYFISDFIIVFIRRANFMFFCFFFYQLKDIYFQISMLQTAGSTSTLKGMTSPSVENMLARNFREYYPLQET